LDETSRRRQWTDDRIGPAWRGVSATRSHVRHMVVCMCVHVCVCVCVLESRVLLNDTGSPKSRGLQPKRSTVMPPSNRTPCRNRVFTLGHCHCHIRFVAAETKARTTTCRSTGGHDARVHCAPENHQQTTIRPCANVAVPSPKASHHNPPSHLGVANERI
jgi:hypothetical protein